MKNACYIVGAFIVLFLLPACQKLPPKMDYLSKNADFNKKDVYEPILGRTTLELTQFNGDASTYPLQFTIINERHAKDGSPAPELSQKIKVQEWIRNYTGYEKSLDEIEKKRIWVEKPFLDIRKGSGDFIFWNAPSSIIQAYPDSGYLFDVKVENKGNTRIFENFYLRPLKEVPYEPYEYDIHTGERKTETRTGSNGQSYVVPFTIHPDFVNNMYYTKDSLFTDTLISVYFYRGSGPDSEGHSLTFKFLDEHFNPISPEQFNPLSLDNLQHIKWDSLVHGFDMVKTDSTVTYQVAYPIPLTSLTTRYAADGKAHIAFGYSRRGFGGKRIDASFGLEFSIYEPGEWTIIFYFRRNPVFADE